MDKKIFCLLLAATIVLGSGLNTLATSKSEVQQQQTETKNRLNEVNKSISTIEKKQKEVREQLDHLDEELVETMLTLELLEADIETKEEEIAEAQKEYKYFKKLEKQQYKAMKRRIQFMYEQGSRSYLSMLLSADSFTDLLNKVDFTKGIYSYDDQKLTEYQETKDKVKETKERLEEEQSELLEVQEDQKIYKEDLDRKIASAKSKAANFEEQMADAKEKVKEYQETIKEQNKKIRELEEEEAKDKEAKEKEAAENTEASEDTGTSENLGEIEAPDSPEEAAPVTGSGTGAEIAAYAVQFVGNPYVYGGTSLTNGADCSGFTWAVHQKFGISIPRKSTDQSRGGTPVSISAVQPGDIIYYGNHVGIYIGNHQIVHASTAKDGIKISSYTYRTPIRAARYW